MAVKIKAGDFYKVINTYNDMNAGDIYQFDKAGRKNTYRVIKSQDCMLRYVCYDEGAYISIKPTLAKEILGPIDAKDVEGLLINDVPLYMIKSKVV